MPPRQIGYKFSKRNAINAQYHILTKLGKTISLRTVVRIFHPNEKVHLILDNARANHAKLVQKFVIEHQNHLELCFLPP